MTHFAWIDCEMSGLDVEKHHILELALVITDAVLLEPIATQIITIHHPQELFLKMDPWCQEHHSKSGLWDRVQQSTSMSYEQATGILLACLEKHTTKKQVYLAGNSVYNDLVFIKKHLPELADWLHYRLVDVSSLKILINEWYPENSNKVFEKKKSHRALDDIHESIEELKHYRKYFFL